MAIAEWLGTSPDINLDSNWVGSKPSDGDEVHVTYKANGPMTLNLDAFDGDGWALLFVGEDAEHGIGEPGNGLAMGAGIITKLVNKSPVAGIYVSTGVVTTGIINSSVPLTKPAFQMEGGTVHNIKAVRGRLNFGAVTWAGDDFLGMSYRGSPNTDVYVELGGDTPADIRQFGGVLQQLVGLGTRHYMEGGEVFVPVGNAGNLTTLAMLGGRYNWDGSGTITNAHLMAGILDATGSTVPKTVTNLYNHPNAEFRRSPDIVTVTNDKDMTGGDV